MSCNQSIKEWLRYNKLILCHVKADQPADMPETQMRFLNLIDFELKSVARINILGR